MGFILAGENLSVLNLQHRLEASKVPVSVKSLCRMAGHSPLKTIDLRIVAAICAAFGIGLDDLFTFEKPKPQLLRLDKKTQARLDALMRKNNEEPLTSLERKEFVTLADRAYRISITNSRTLIAERLRAGNQGRRPKSRQEISAKLKKK